MPSLWLNHPIRNKYKSNGIDHPQLHVGMKNQKKWSYHPALAGPLRVLAMIFKTSCRLDLPPRPTGTQNDLSSTSNILQRLWHQIWLFTSRCRKLDVARKLTKLRVWNAVTSTCWYPRQDSVSISIRLRITSGSARQPPGLLCFLCAVPGRTWSEILPHSHSRHRLSSGQG